MSLVATVNGKNGMIGVSQSVEAGAKILLNCGDAWDTGFSGIFSSNFMTTLLSAMGTVEFTLLGDAGIATISL
jgi:hypothetical protein